MISKANIHKFINNNIFIVFIFLIMSISSSIILFHYKYVPVGIDGYFHTQRLYDLHMSLKNGKIFPLVALNGFNQTGSAVMGIYPQYIILPVTIISFIIKSVVNFVYTTFVLRNFIALIISYYSCYSFSKNKKTSFIFSTIYTLNAVVLSYAIMGYDLGRTATLIFLPMVLFGFYNLLNNDGWMQLSLGMSGIIISHVLNSAITVIFILILFLFNINRVNSTILKLLSKSILVSAMLTSAFWIPFLLLNIRNSVWIPRYWSNLTGIDFIHVISSSTSNSVDSISITIFALSGLILALLYYKKLSLYSKQMLIISIIVLVFISQLFPWNILDSTFIKNVLQFPWRFLIIPQLLLCYLFSEISNTLLFKTSKNKNVAFIVFVITSLMLQLSAQKGVIDNTFLKPEITSSYNQGNVYYKIYNNSDLNNIINTTNITGTTDYYPSRAISKENDLNNHIATYDNKSLPVKLGGNGTFYINVPHRIRNLSLPFLYYNGINYEVLLDGHQINISHDSNDLMTVNNLNKGQHKIQIIVHKTAMEILSYLISASGIIIVLFSIIKQIKKRKK